MTPLRTAELRWFAEGPTPDAVRDWFDRLGPAVEAEARTDRYLVPASDALGLKLREGRVEAKRRDAVLGPLRTGRAAATVEAWTKWSFPLAETPDVGDGWVEVRKTRWQRHAEAAGGACALELSEVAVGDAVWWSVCLEAEGPTPERRTTAVGAGAARWLADPAAPALPADTAQGYPAWLRSVVGP